MEKILRLKNRCPKTDRFREVGNIRFKDISAERAELYFYGDIVSDSWGVWTSEDKCPQDITNFLSSIDPYQIVDIYINSGGGSVYGGLAIYQQLKRHSGEKIVHVDGIAASIASVIAFAGDRLIVPKAAQMMIHKPSSSMRGGTADDYRKEADALDVCERSIVNVYMEHAKENIPEEQIRQMIDTETWLTGDLAAQYFNIEVEEAAEAVACASDYFDRYKNTPAAMLHPAKSKDITEQLQIELDLLNL